MRDDDDMTRTVVRRAIERGYVVLFDARGREIEEREPRDLVEQVSAEFMQQWCCTPGYKVRHW